MQHATRTAAVTVAAAVVAATLQATTAVAAHATPTSASVGTADAAAAPSAIVTDADAQEGAVAAIVRDDEGRPRIVEVTAPTVAEAKRKAAAVPGAESISVDAPTRIAAVPEPYRGSQWGHDKLLVDSLPTTDNSKNIVAVVDTGVRASHEDFGPGQLMCLEGSDFVDGDGITNACVDGHGHGTHVAGIVAAPVNAKGISGIAPGTRILPVRVLGSSGSGSTHSVAKGIMWAADQGATVINASLGGPTFVQALDDAVAYATSKGALVVAAAGNDRQEGSPTNWPAASPGALSVASTSQSGLTSDFSTTGPTVDIAAPGDGILSLHIAGDSAYAFMSGTSMASPYVAGVASLVKAKHSSYTPAQLTEALVSTAVDMETAGRDDKSGAGLVNPLTLLTGQQPPPERIYEAPAAPTGVTTHAGDRRVAVSWAAVPSTETAPVSRYRVHRNGSLVHTTTGAAVTSFTDTSVTNGTTYSYAVTALGTGGESVTSASVTATPTARPLAAPASPRGLRGTSGDGRVSLTWDAVASAQDAPLDAYRVYRDGSLVHTSGTSTGFVDSQVLNGTTYSYSVSAVGAGGESARSDLIRATPTAPPATTTPAPAETAPPTEVPAPVAPAPAPVAPAPVVPAPVVAPAPPAPAPAPPAAAPAKPVLTPLPARVAPGQKVPVKVKDYRPASVVTVTQTYQVRESVRVRQPVTKLVAKRVTVKGATVVRKVPVVTGYRTVPVVRLVTRTTKLGDLRVRPDGTVAGSVLPLKGVAGGVLTVTGVDRSGKAVVVRSAVRVG